MFTVFLFKDMDMPESSPPTSNKSQDAEAGQTPSDEAVVIKPTFEMKRELGFISSIAMIIGTIVGM